MKAVVSQNQHLFSHTLANQTVTYEVLMVLIILKKCHPATGLMAQAARQPRLARPVNHDSQKKMKKEGEGGGGSTYHTEMGHPGG